MLQFVRSFAAGRRNGHGWEFLQVDGGLWLDVAVADDDRDEAYWCWVALEAFQSAFSAVWERIIRQSADNLWLSGKTGLMRSVRKKDFHASATLFS